MRQRASSFEYVEQLARDLGPGPWTVQAVAAAGWSRGRIDAAVLAGRLVRLRHGVLGQPTRTPSSGELGRVVLRALRPSAALSHSTAAGIHGQWTPRGQEEELHVIVPGASERIDGRLRVHGSRLPDHHVEVVDGCRVTTVARTGVDLARGPSVPDALVAVDGAARALIRREVPSATYVIRSGQLPDAVRARVRDGLEEAFSLVWSWPGTRAVRTALDLLDPASESPAESWSRGWILMSGLPRPTSGFAVRGRSGQLYFADLAWPEAGVIGEVDGVTKYGSTPRDIRSVLAAERARQQDLEAAGWVVVRWLAHEAPPRWLPRLTAALSSPASYRRNAS